MEKVSHAPAKGAVNDVEEVVSEASNLLDDSILLKETQKESTSSTAKQDLSKAVGEQETDAQGKETKAVAQDATLTGQGSASLTDFWIQMNNQFQLIQQQLQQLTARFRAVDAQSIALQNAVNVRLNAMEGQISAMTAGLDEISEKAQKSISSNESILRDRAKTRITPISSDECARIRTLTTENLYNDPMKFMRFRAF